MPTSDSSHPDETGDMRDTIGRIAHAAKISRDGLNRRLGIDGYELLREIARGGQAVVYLAKRLADGKAVAVKILTDQGDRRAIKRLQAEAAVLRRLDHPNIVACHEVIATDHACYLVMDYVPGVPLTVLLDEMSIRRASLTSLRNMLDMLAKVCRALHAAHEAGVTHRDIKPPNIRIDEQGTPFLLDFGLATVADESTQFNSMHTAVDHGHFVGTLFWSSPEQISGGEATRASDIWSLGLILHQMLTANAAPYSFDRGIASAIRDASRGQVRIPESFIPAVAELGDHADQYARSLLSYMLSPRPSDRPQTALIAAEHLDSLLEGGGDLGELGSGPRRSRRWLSLLTGSLIVLAGVVLAGTMWGDGGGPGESEGPAVIGFTDGSLSPMQVRKTGQFYDILVGDGLEFRWVPPGSVTLGIDPSRPRWWTSLEGDNPSRPYTNESGFWMLRFEVHQAGYEAVTGTNPSQHIGESRPVEMVSYEDAVAFCEQATEKFGVVIRLPTSDEWEYACRAGTETMFSYGDDVRLTPRYANAADASNPDVPTPGTYDDGYPLTAPFGRFLQNGFGLADMHGNVWEWCQSPYLAIPGDPASAVTDRADARGGSYYDGPASLESGHRNPLPVSTRSGNVGFRVIAELPPPQ